jgi:hypothetical protein
MSFASKVFAIRPLEFYSNEETKLDNTFMQDPDNAKMDPVTLSESVQTTFESFVSNLAKNKIGVTVFDQTNPQAPDSIFPDWFTTHRNKHVPHGVLILYPMKYPSRRIERDPVMVAKLKAKFKDVIDLTHFESEEKALEGKGAVVFDYRNKRIFVALSQRAHKEVIDELISKWNEISTEPYSAVTFNGYDLRGDVIYHTDCMLVMLENHAIACLDAIRDDTQRQRVVEALSNGVYPYQIIQLELSQVDHMCANMQGIFNADEEACIILSEQAYTHLAKEQRETLSNNYTLVITNIDPVEYIGGGSCRCMLVEDFSASEP